MKTYNGNISVESIFSDDELHRFVLRRKYSTTRTKLSKRKLVFIMINPTYSDELLFDKTNRLASNIGVRDECNEVVILNLFSLITKDTQTLEMNSKNAYLVENDQYIFEEVKNAYRLIIAWGIKNQYQNRINAVKQIIRNAGITDDRVYSVKFIDKRKKVYNPAHLSMYITDNPPNYQMQLYRLD